MFSVDDLNFSSYDYIPLPIVVTHDWDILYANDEAKQVFQIQDIDNKSLLDFLNEEQKNFFKFQVALIKPEELKSFSITLQVGDQLILIICLIKLFKDKNNNCYFFIVLQKIEAFEEKFQKLSKIIIDTFTLFGKALFKTLLKKLSEEFKISGTFIYVHNENLTNQQKFLYESYFQDNINLNIEDYRFSEKLQKRLDKYGTIIVEKSFSTQYPEDLLAKENIELFIGIKINISKDERLYIVAFSKSY